MRHPIEKSYYETSDKRKFDDFEKANAHEQYLAETEGSLYWKIASKGKILPPDNYHIKGK